MTTIAFIGLGNMGGPMAQNLIKAGFTLKVFDLVEDSMQTAIKAGAQACSSAHEAAEDASVIISMLPAGQHVKSLYLGESGLLQQLPAATLVIDCSTIDADSAREVHAACVEKSILMLDAPVSGGVAAAAAGTLTFMCGGEEDAYSRAEPVLKGMGQQIFHAGPAGSGQVAKMCNNMLLAIHMVGTSEALKLGDANGLDAKVLSDIMLASSGKNWSLERYNPFPGVMKNAPASNQYQPGFMVDLMTKDLGLAMENAQACGAQTPLGLKAQSLYQAKQAKGDGRKDFSSIIDDLEG